MLDTRRDHLPAPAPLADYDERGNPATITHSGSLLGQDVYIWDANGNPTSKRTLTGTTTWVYDALDQLIAEWHELGVITTWS